MTIETVLDGFYTRRSWMYGGGWVSYERGVKVGTVRVINEILSQAWSVRSRGLRKPEVLWKNVEPHELRKVDINERP